MHIQCSHMDYLFLVPQVLALLLIAAICSGLNITLMALDIDDLRRKVQLGNQDARRILGLRENVHLTLSAILLTNVAAASATPLVLNNSFSGIVAGAISTMSLVVFGEILPQALFARHALRFFSFFSPLIKAMVFVTYPVSKPLQLALDKLVGTHGIRLHSRHELGVIVDEHLGNTSSELDEDEIEIIRGALQLSEKRVRDIMTPIRKVFWLTPETLIDAKKIDDIQIAGRSRIPVFNKQHTVCHGVVLMKEMVDINFDDNPIPVSELRLHSSKVIGAMTALDTLFRKFIGAQSHLLPVEKDGKISGIVTIEDLIEEIIGHEIRDESDRTTKRA